jgi:hypothetical protein
MEISEPRLRNLLRQAERNAENGKLAAAEALYRQILQEAPQTAAAWAGLAGVIIDRSEKRAAYERALALEPDNAAALAGLAGAADASARVLAGEPAEKAAPEPLPVIADQPVESRVAQSPLVREREEGDGVAVATERAADQATSQPEAESYELFCYRHPERVTSLRCYNCNRPICIKCANKTPVGYICPECMREAEDTFFNSRPLDYLLAAIVSFPPSLLAGWLLLNVNLGFFFFLLIFFISGAVGSFIGSLTKRAVGRRRGRYLPQLVVVMMILGALLPAVLGFLTGGLNLFGLIGLGIYLFVGGGAAYWQMR